MEKKLKKVMVLNGSLRANSSAAVVLNSIVDLFSEAIDFNIYEDIINLPPFNDPDEATQIVTLFRHEISTADGVLIITPEYAFGIPGALKNALDRTVISGEFSDKKVCLITAATSGAKAHAAMLDVLKALSCDVSANRTLLINFITSRIKDKKIADEATIAQIKSVLNSFIDNLG